MRMVCADCRGMLTACNLRRYDLGGNVIKRIRQLICMVLLQGFVAGGRLRGIGLVHFVLGHESKR